MTKFTFRTFLFLFILLSLTYKGEKQYQPEKMMESFLLDSYKRLGDLSQVTGETYADRAFRDAEVELKSGE